MGIDIEPKITEENVSKRDFLSWSTADLPDPKKAAVIDNPPFGRKGKTTIEFIAHTNTLAETIARCGPSSQLRSRAAFWLLGDLF